MVIAKAKQNVASHKSLIITQRITTLFGLSLNLVIIFNLQ